jgi:hypothetical protein
MLKLFQSIFGGAEQPGRYPEALIAAAIERAVDGTDPRLRALSGYRKHLRPAVIHAIDHVVALVDAIPAPLAVLRSSYNTDLRLKALFSSASRMQEVFGNDAAFNEFLGGPGKDAKCVIALLLAERVEKNVLGMDLAGDILRRDVPQLSVSFRSHRLLDSSATEVETRRQLKRRAFDHLLALALTRIVEVKGERIDLTHQRDLLQRKLNALNKGGWSFDEAAGVPSEPNLLIAELQEIEAELSSLGTDAAALQGRLDIIAGLLGHAEQHLWAEDVVIHLDSMNIRRDENDASAPGITLQELHNSRGARLTLLLVSLQPAELPQRESVISAAERYLI